MEFSLFLQALTSETSLLVPSAKKSEGLNGSGEDFSVFLKTAAGEKSESESEENGHTRQSLEMGGFYVPLLCFSVPAAVVEDNLIQSGQQQYPESAAALPQKVPLSLGDFSLHVNPASRLSIPESQSAGMNGEEATVPEQKALTSPRPMQIYAEAPLKAPTSPQYTGFQPQTDGLPEKADASVVFRHNVQPNTNITKNHQAAAAYLIKTGRPGDVSIGLPEQTNGNKAEHQTAVLDLVAENEQSGASSNFSQEGKETLDKSFDQGRSLFSELESSGVGPSAGQRGEIPPDFKEMLFSQFHVRTDEAKPPTHAGRPANSQQPDSYGIMSQIIEHARLIARPQNSEMIIRLKPEHLGELTLKVAVEQGVVTATFHSSNSEVRSVIESSLPQLRQELVSSGLKVDYVGVYSGLSQQSYSQDQQGHWHQQKIKMTAREVDEDVLQAVEKVVGHHSLGEATGVDYRV